MDRKTPIEKAGRLYKLYARRLEKLNIKTFEDFLYHIPSRYDDYSLISKIARVQAGETVTIRGTVTEINNEFTKNFKRIQKAVITDDTGSIEVVWFNQPYLTKVIHKEDNVSLSGQIGWFLKKLVLQSPEYEMLTDSATIHTGRLVPVYPETRGVSSKWLRRQVHKLLVNLDQIHEYLPQMLIDDNNLMSLSKA